ncbi:MAG: DUF4249 family protein [Saprospiraceae bacterium]|nr:DUF4249 family protein [Saprospiraceae bacterium]
MSAFNIRSLLIVAAFFSLFSCEEIVELPFDLEPTIEIRSRLSEDGLNAQILLAKSAADNTSTQYIDEATVKVFKKNAFLQQLVLSSDANNLPCYKTENWVPEFDVEYTLLVEVEGFKPVRATTSVPKPVSIEEPIFENTSIDDGSEMVQVNFDVSFSITDPVGTSNYYHLSFYQELYDYTLDSQGTPALINNSKQYAKIAIKEADESGPAERLRHSDYLFSDEQFSGQLLRMAFEGSFVYDKAKKVPGQFFVVLRTVSEDYYLSEKSKQSQPNNNDGEIVKGDVIFNNTDNGVGTFAGFTSNTNMFKLQG